MAQNRNLRAFMRESAKTEKIIKVPGPAFIQEDGKPVTFEVKVLNADTLRKINEKYQTQEVALDPKGNPYIHKGELVYSSQFDAHKASAHILVEALIHPNLKDSELMQYFDCVDVTEMPTKVFPTIKEFEAVNTLVLKAIGLRDGDKPSDAEDLEEAKN